MSDGKLDYLDRLCKLMHRNGVHELADGEGVHIALLPKPPLPRGRAANKKPQDPNVYLGVPSDEELLYWSAGGPPPKGDAENPEATMDPNDIRKE